MNLKPNRTELDRIFSELLTKYEKQKGKELICLHCAFVVNSIFFSIAESIKSWGFGCNTYGMFSLPEIRTKLLRWNSNEILTTAIHIYRHHKWVIAWANHMSSRTMMVYSLYLDVMTALTSSSYQGAFFFTAYFC